MNQIHAMRVFVHVVDFGSFALAARHMNLCPAGVTRAVCTLEQHLSMRLLNRSTRSMSLTDAGRLYLDGCREIVRHVDEVEADLKRATKDVSGILRVAAPAMFAHGGLGDLLSEYRKDNRGVKFDVTIFDRHINMVEDGFDICFISSRVPVAATLVSRPLFSVKDVVVATPTYLNRRGVPDHPRSLDHHDLLAVIDAPHPWELLENGQKMRISGENVVSSSNCLAVKEAALAHMGIALLPKSIVKAELSRGSLRQILEKFPLGQGEQNLALVYSGRNYLTMRVRSFVDFATKYFHTRLAEPTPLRVVA
jgi:DNA-binding transcriptional LysR family regulator